MAKQLFVFVLIALLALATRITMAPSAEASGVSVVSAGGHNACVLSTAGAVKCWGDNGAGQLGEGMNTGPEACGGVQPCSTTPVDVVGLSSGIRAISVGSLHACALTTAAGIKCWGYNTYGELGDGSNIWRFVPVDVTGLTSGVAAISAGGYHSCALTTAGGVKCWGYNFYGQLGNGTTTDSNVPVDVLGLTSGVAAVSTGYLHTCALTITGGIKCWGRNAEGQLGIGTTSGPQTCGPFACSNASLDVSGLTSGAASVSAGSYHTCALTTGGGVKCSGPTLTDVSGLTSGVAAISAGGSQSCAVTSSGGLKCWGGNAYGMLGDGTTSARATPVDVSGLTSSVASVSAGEAHTCALTSGGDVKCWGLNSFGELGIGTATGPEICQYSPLYNCSTVPVDVISEKRPPVGGVSLDPSAALSPARTASHRSAAFPFGALALVGVSSAVGAIWFARRRTASP